MAYIHEAKAYKVRFYSKIGADIDGSVVPKEPEWLPAYLKLSLFTFAVLVTTPLIKELSATGVSVDSVHGAFLPLLGHTGLLQGLKAYVYSHGFALRGLILWKPIHQRTSYTTLVWCKDYNKGETLYSGRWNRPFRFHQTSVSYRIT